MKEKKKEIHYTTGSQESLYNISGMCEDGKVVVMAGLGLSLVKKTLLVQLEKRTIKFFV